MGIACLTLFRSKNKEVSIEPRADVAFGDGPNGYCDSGQAESSLVAQTVKHLPTMTTMWETGVQSLGWEDILEKEMGTHSSILAWKIPWMVEPGRLQSMGLQRVRHD